MPIKRVGHVVLKMRDLEQAKEFYHGLLGMEIANDLPFAVFFRFGDYHHDIAVFKVSENARAPEEDQVGLSHVALVCDSEQTVRGYYDRCKEHGVQVSHPQDFKVTRGFYVHDPDGNRVEIYADAPYDWRTYGMAAQGTPYDIESVPPPSVPV